MRNWDSLSLKEKSEMMKVAIINGYTNLHDIKAKYNEFADGGGLNASDTTEREDVTQTEKVGGASSYIGGTPEEVRQAYWKQYPRMVAVTDSIASMYGIDPHSLRNNLNREGFVDARIREHNDSVMNNRPVPDADEGLRRETYGEAMDEYGLDNVGQMIEDGKVIPIGNPNYDLQGNTNEKNQPVYTSEGYTHMDNINLSAAALKYFGTVVDNDYPNLSQHDRNRYIRAYYNRGVEGGRKWARNGAKGYSFADGGKLSDEQYIAIMERVAEENNPIWNKFRQVEGGKPLTVDEELLRILNDNTYNYRGYYNKYRNSRANADTHWTDEFKTVYHPTFSNQSRYSGKKSQYNPEGLVGGTWGGKDGEKFIPAPWQMGNTFADGGSIHIDPKNRGKFNATKARTGKTTEELTHSKNPLTRKRAIFAQNTAKWHHKDEGGFLDSMEDEPTFFGKYLDGVTVTPYGSRDTTFKDWSKANQQEREETEKQRILKQMEEFNNNIRRATSNVAPYAAGAMGIAALPALLPATVTALDAVAPAASKVLAHPYVQGYFAGEGAVNLKDRLQNGTFGINGNGFWDRAGNAAGTLFDAALMSPLAKLRFPQSFRGSKTVTEQPLVEMANAESLAMTDDEFAKAVDWANDYYDMENAYRSYVHSPQFKIDALNDYNTFIHSPEYTERLKRAGLFGREFGIRTLADIKTNPDNVPVKFVDEIPGYKDAWGLSTVNPTDPRYGILLKENQPLESFKPTLDHEVAHWATGNVETELPPKIWVNQGTPYSSFIAKTMEYNNNIVPIRSWREVLDAYPQYWKDAKSGYNRYKYQSKIQERRARAYSIYQQARREGLTIDEFVDKYESSTSPQHQQLRNLLGLYTKDNLKKFLKDFLSIGVPTSVSATVLTSNKNE